MTDAAARAARHETTVVIIGAGPAGLAAAACLGRRGVPYVLLEQGAGVAAALAKVHPLMTLVSPTPLSRLPHMQPLDDEPDYLALGRYLEILEAYRAHHGIDVTTHARVLDVESTDAGFEVRFAAAAGSTRAVTCRFVINATGVLSSPRLPADFDATATALRWRHSRDVTPAELAESRRLLVVGGGLSADDVIADWRSVRSEDTHAWLALRSPLWIMPKTLFGVDVHYLIQLPERLPVLPKIWRRFQTNPILGYELPAAIRLGLVEEVPTVDAYHPDHVILIDGSRLEPDLVVFATGYTYATPHLGELFQWPAGERPRLRRCESLDTPGLFLLGIHFARTFASPYLRGIGRDASYVARRIARRLDRGSV